jgi:hypothetical protein
MKTAASISLAMLLLLAAARPARAEGAAADPPQTARTWLYASLTAGLSPSLSFTVMPGLRFEMARSGAEAKRLYMLELFLGPNFTARVGRLTFKCSLWYYFTGYPSWGIDPVTSSHGYGAFTYGHNLEVVPTFEVRLGRWLLLDRIILHSIVYSDVYGKPSLDTGYSLVMRNLVQVRYAATERLGLLLGDEPFIGLIEDSDTRNLPKGYDPRGFWKQGIRLNRIYTGVDLKVAPSLTVTAMYMLEHLLTSDRTELKETGHYLFVTLSFALKLF